MFTLKGGFEQLGPVAINNCAGDSSSRPDDSALVSRFREAMDDDCNTPRALGVIFEGVREMNRELDAGKNNAQRAWSVAIIVHGVVTVEQEKMSKSLGNFLTIGEALAKVSTPEVLRQVLLSSHYRMALDFSTQKMEEAEKGLIRIYETLARADEAIGDSSIMDEPALRTTASWPIVV